ncbi:MULTISPECIES: hypothetical protein [Myroides]|uniref:Lipoprotein n=1 Tax=Myroides albus TaxID=2562892 RepID=A0A6I3LND6_9FLAO|nr:MULTISPECIES: hypothetical protein [Myroides]MTG98111.1 hypothetical protein [Myroides albus]MVX36690.1 hypothetical protein [Myroides sp. LoEW2-1]UVD78598.1 hypothetical protein NWE55_10730 [Myroides albus]
MRKISLLLLGILLTTFQSCVMKEEIHVSKKGKVDYAFNINFSELLKVSPGASKSMGKDIDNAIDFFNGQELTIDQYLDIILAKEDNAAFKKDSLKAAHPDIFANLENLRMQFTVNDSIGDISFKIDSKDVTELNNALKGLEQIGKLTGKNDKAAKESLSVNSVISDKTYYEFKNNVFERKVKPSNKEGEKPTMEGMEQMFTYVMVVSFDKKIKSVSYDDAKISKDGKSFTKEIKMGDIIKDPSVLGYTVELK